MSIPTLDRSIQALVSGKADRLTPVVQIIDCKDTSGGGNKKGTKIAVVISDGINSCSALLLKPTEPVEKYCIIKIRECLKHHKELILILQYSVEQKYNKQIGNPKPYSSSSKDDSSSTNTSSSGSSKNSSKSKGQNAALNFYDDDKSNNDNVPIHQLDQLSEDQVQPIANLNTYQPQWVIKARVTQKGEMKHWDKGASKGCLFSIDLLDEWGGQIRATFFQDVAKRYFDHIQEKNVYLFSGGTLKPANKKFTTLPHTYEITFGSDTIIQHAPSDDNIPEGNFNFTKLGDISNVDDNTVLDVVGIVKEIQDIKEFTTKANKKTHRRIIKLIDNSNGGIFEIEVTFWGEQYADLPFKEEDAVILKSVRKSSYNGVSLNSIGSTRIITDTDVKEYTTLIGWYEDMKNRGMQDTESNSVVRLTQRQSAANSEKSFKRKNFIQDIKALSPEDVTEPLFMTVRAYVNYIKTEGGMYYDACPNKTCNGKKVAKHGDEYYCKNCNKTYPHCERKYLLNFSIIDATGNQWLSSFNTAAEEILEETANTMNDYNSRDYSSFQNTISKATFSRFVFGVRLQSEKSNNSDDLRLKANNELYFYVNNTSKEGVIDLKSYNNIKLYSGLSTKLFFTHTCCNNGGEKS
ncbi:hypothetical protein ABK040_010163 [Willaertia magna]